MHEFSITQDMVTLVEEKAAGRQVVRISLAIGRLSGIIADAVRFCFDVCAQSTAAEGAQLEIDEIPGRGRCADCLREMELDQPYGQCECGSVRIDLIAGTDLRVTEMEVI